MICSQQRLSSMSDNGWVGAVTQIKRQETHKREIKTSCGVCGKDMTGVPLGGMKSCKITREEGCPDKGDGGW